MCRTFVSAYSACNAFTVTPSHSMWNDAKFKSIECLCIDGWEIFFYSLHNKTETLFFVCKSLDLFFTFQLQFVCLILKFSILGNPFMLEETADEEHMKRNVANFFSSVPLPPLQIFAIVKINHWNKNSEIRKFFRLTFQRLFVTTFHYIIWLTQHGVIQFISFSRKSNSVSCGVWVCIVYTFLCLHLLLAVVPCSLPRTGVSFCLFFTRRFVFR